MSIEKVVRYFEHYVEELPRKRPSAEVTNKMEELAQIANEVGLEPALITRIVDVAGCGKLTDKMAVQIVRSLIPAETVPELAVLKAVSWMCTNKPSSAVQSRLLQWIVLVYEFIDGHDQLHAVYQMIFFFLQDDQMCPYVCHLLYLLTRRHDVEPFRVRELVQIQRRLGSLPYINGLISLYKLYRPDLVTLTMPTMQKPFYKYMDLTWGKAIMKVQRKRAEQSGDPRSETSQSASSLNRTADMQFLAPVKKRTKMVVPPLEMCTVRTDRMSRFHRLATPVTRPKVSIMLIKSFDELLDNLDNVEMPAKMASVFEHANLQHVASLRVDEGAAMRINYWVVNALEEEFSCEPSRSAMQRQGKLLQDLVDFSEFLQESMPVWENFLMKYLHTWNGVDHSVQIFKLLTRIRLAKAEVLKDLVLEPLRKLFFASSVYFKCQVLWCLTHVLRNYVAVELPRYESSLQTQLAALQNPSATPKPDFRSMFQEPVEQFSPVDTITALVKFVDMVCVITRPLERDHALFSHCYMDFFTQVTTVYHTSGLPIVSLPHRANFYRSLFTTDVITICRLADLMIRYRQVFTDLQQFKKTPTTPNTHALACRQSFQQIHTFNIMLSDMCNALMIPESLYPTKSGSVYTLLETPAVAQIEAGLEDAAFHLLRHPALKGHVQGFLRQARPRIKELNSSNLPGVVDRFLIYLDKHHVTSIPTFIHTNIRSAGQSDAADTEEDSSASDHTSPSETDHTGTSETDHGSQSETDDARMSESEVF